MEKATKKSVIIQLSGKALVISSNVQFREMIWKNFVFLLKETSILPKF